ncbi:MAG: sulfite exporter TauE/SafE family protein [Candidatus Limnocylindrales bacterium]
MVVGLLMVVSGAAAGMFGSLLGLGGGVLIVPLLTLGFGLPLRDAVGVSLVCVIMTSSAAAGVYLERHIANLRLGMTLELFTATGALVGGSIAFLLDERLLSGLFAALLLYVAATMLRSGLRSARRTVAVETAVPAVPASEARSEAAPAIHGMRIGVVGSFGAGIISALLGIGGGIIKVPLMHLAMGVPLRVATATSNLMIGITAAASAVIYALNGGIDPYVAGPTAIGVFVGATAGSRIAHRIDLRYLRVLFVVVLGYTAIQMLIKALG